MNNSKGSFVFAKDNDVLYIDMDGDSTLNSDDYAFALTGLDSFHGADLDIEIYGEDSDATTITTLDGDDNINTGSGNDIINSGGGADIIVGLAGVNTINSGAGNDTITTTSGADIINAGAGDDIINSGTGIDKVTAGTGDDIINGDGRIVTANRLEVLDFEDAGDTVGDVLKLATEGSTEGTAAGAVPDFETVTVTEANADASYLMTAATAATTDLDVIELIGTDKSHGVLETDFDTGGNGTELLKLLSSSGTAASITNDVKTDKYYIIAYDDNSAGGTSAYIYHVDATTNAVAQVAADILPIFKLDGVAEGALVAADFLMV
jgi:hypothetical protein